MRCRFATRKQEGPKYPDSFENEIGIRLVRIEAGTFFMGSVTTEPHRDDYERQCQVTLTRDYYCAIHHVTCKQFARFVDDTGYRTQAERDRDRGSYIYPKGSPRMHHPNVNWRNPGFAQGDNHPVLCVSWGDAVAFCDWLTQKARKGLKGRYRLPTEAEFEYACRAGTQTTYLWGNEFKDGERWCNIAGQEAKPHMDSREFAPWKDGYVYTAPVSTFWPNAWGLYDMVGNAYQWCSDYYGKYPDHAVTDYKGPMRGNERVIRGTAWGGEVKWARVAARGHQPEDYRDYGVGFRVVFDPDMNTGAGVENEVSGQRPGDKQGHGTPRTGESGEKVKDALLEGSVWAGECRAMTKPGDTFHSSWKITKRDGNTFEAIQYNEGIPGKTDDQELGIRGTIGGNKVEAHPTRFLKGTLTGNERADQDFLARCSYTGTVSDQELKLKITIKSDGRGGRDERGEFRFKAR